VTAAGGTISLLVGAVLLRLTLTGTYRRYVRVEMGPWLVVAGAVVVVLGLVTLARAIRRDRFVDAHGHHREVDRVGWLLLAPIAALLLVAPPRSEATEWRERLPSTSPRESPSSND
jgi:uncharacterized protein DUF1980